jgi:predicted HicB family RNase H-like nuclease
LNQLLNYKGYHGSVEVNVEGGYLYGKLLYIRDVVAYESSSIQGIRIAFEAAVDDYLQTCNSLGDEPEVPCKGSFNVRLGPNLHLQCVLSAERASTSLNDWVKQACQAALTGRAASSSAQPVSAADVHIPEVSITESFPRTTRMVIGRTMASPSDQIMWTH